MLAFDAFNATWLIGLTCFGVHLALLGSMTLRSGIAPRALGTLLNLAGAAYVVDTVAYSLLESYEDYDGFFTALVAVPAILAEAGLTLWLLRSAGTEKFDPPTNDTSQLQVALR